jgi:transcriptional regulator with XRE-family HTH domain
MAAQRKTAIDLASVIGVSPATAARCVAGARPLDINQLEATAQWLEVSIDRIISPAQGLAYSK